MPDSGDLASAVAEAARFFGLGTVLRASPIEESLANRNLRVGTDRGEFVVRVCDEHEPADVALEVGYARHAAAHGIPCPQYLNGPGGEPVLRHAGGAVLAQRLVAGRHPPRSAGLCAALGRVLARLHSIPLPDLPPRSHWLAPGGLQRLIGPLREVHALAGHPLFEAFAAHDPPGDAPRRRCVVHGDPHECNLLWRDGRIAALLDWEEAAVADGLLDAGMAVYLLCVEDGAVHPERLRAFVAGYRSVSRVADLERGPLAAAVRHAELTVTAWQLHRHAVRRPDPERLAAAARAWRCAPRPVRLPRSAWARPGAARGTAGA